MYSCRTYFSTIILSFILSFFLFFPWNKTVYEEINAITYSSFTYELIIWKTSRGRNNVNFCLFPENLKDNITMINTQ